MENNKEGELGEFIESSQVPTLRTKIRENKPKYTWPKSPQRVKRKPPKRFRDNKTVSQCLRQVWKKSPAKPSSAGTATKQPASEANAASAEEDYIMFPPTQQEAPTGEIQPMPSVSLFVQQENALARYIFNETTEAQVEAQLQKLLDGFQAEYQQQCAGMDRSPVANAAVVRAAASQLTLLNETNMELEELPAKESREKVSPLQAISDLIPNINEEMQRMEEMLEKNNPLQTNPSLLPVSVITTSNIPLAELREEIPQAAKANTAISIATDNVCLDLTKQMEQSKDANRVLTPTKLIDERETVNQNHFAHMRNANSLNPQPLDAILDLRVNKPQTIPHTATNYSARTIGPNQPHITTTSDCGIQTNLRCRRRNVAVQHRTAALFELTDRNIIVLAQQLEADPSMLQGKLRRIAKTFTEAIWRARDLSTVFTTADPYYANLKHFL